MKNLSRVCLVIFLFFLPLAGQGVNFSNSLVINEICWMGTNASANDEWIELYNNTENSINLSGWALKSTDGTPEIELSGEISPKSFYLLERTDDTTVPEILADQIYKGALGNKGENLKLYDSSDNLIDEVNCSSGWVAGNNKTKQTMERTGVRPGSDPKNRQTSQNPGGTPKAKNSEQRTTNNEQKVEDGPLPAYPTGVIFNEILPSPEGPDDQEEWIELYNQNNFPVNLSGWQIKDKLGKLRTYTFPIGSEISGKGFLVILRPDSKIVLNNSGDGLELIQPNNNLTDKISYEKAPTGESYNRDENEWFWNNNLTPGKENFLPEEEKLNSHENSSRGGQTASVGEKLPQSKRFSVFFIAFGLALFSGIVILILKRLVKSI